MDLPTAYPRELRVDGTVTIGTGATAPTFSPDQIRLPNTTLLEGANNYLHIVASGSGSRVRVFGPPQPLPDPASFVPETDGFLVIGGADAQISDWTLNGQRSTPRDRNFATLALTKGSTCRFTATNATAYWIPVGRPLRGTPTFPGRASASVGGAAAKRLRSGTGLG